MSYFITFEGIEGSGKSTQIQLLAEELRQRKIHVVTTREPGGTPLGKHLRALLLQTSENVAPLCELLLYAADRAQHCAELIRPALEKKQWVLSDRFVDSTWAYQRGGRGIDPTFLDPIQQLATAGLKPHLTFLFDCPVEVGLQRAQTRAQQDRQPLDRLEKETLAFHLRVRNAYLELAALEKNRFVILDASSDQIEIQKNILAVLTERGFLAVSS